jgi:hypothetical protein
MLIALLIGICAWVYVDILTREHMILGKVSIYLNNKLPIWIYKPLIGCSYCVAGQLAFWCFIFFQPYNFLYHIAFICISIFSVTIINKLMYGQP